MSALGFLAFLYFYFVFMQPYWDDASLTKEQRRERT